MGAPDAEGRRGTQMWMGPDHPSQGAPEPAAAPGGGVRWMPSAGELGQLPSFPTPDAPSSAPRRAPPGIDPTAATLNAPLSSVMAPIPATGPSVGELIGGRYRLVRHLGGGSLSQTWEAEHVELGRRVALKFLRQQAAGVTETMLAVARSVARVQHPHVAGFTDSGRQPSGDPYFVMELLAGETVASVLERKRTIPWARAVNVAQQVCLGLSAAHQQGVIHRDIRPGNVFLIDTGNPADFAKVVDFALAQGTRIGGTPAYMSPEQCRHEQLDPRSDVYSVGCLLFAMVTGDPPFGTGTDNLQWRQLNEAPKTLRERAPRQFIPDELEAVVSRCLHKHPAQRFADTAELHAALADLANFAATTSLAAGVIPSESSQSAPMSFAGRKAESKSPSSSSTAKPKAAPAAGFSAEAVVGIVLASLVAVAVAGFGVWWLVGTLIGGDEEAAPAEVSAPAESGDAPASTKSAVEVDEAGGAAPPKSEASAPAEAATDSTPSSPSPEPEPGPGAASDPASEVEGGSAAAKPKSKAQPAASGDAAPTEASEPPAEPAPEPAAPKPTKPESKANENIGHDDLVDPWN